MLLALSLKSMLASLLLLALSLKSMLVSLLLLLLGIGGVEVLVGVNIVIVIVTGVDFNVLGCSLPS